MYLHPTQPLSTPKISLHLKPSSLDLLAMAERARELRGQRRFKSATGRNISKRLILNLLSLLAAVTAQLPGSLPQPTDLRSRASIGRKNAPQASLAGALLSGGSVSTPVCSFSIHKLSESPGGGDNLLSFLLPGAKDRYGCSELKLSL